MNTMETPEGKGDLILSWHQEMRKNPDEYRIVLRFSIMFIQFYHDSSNGVDHNKYLSDLRRQSTVDKFFSKASILHPNIFRVTYKASNHHGFDRPLHRPPNSRYSRTVAWIIYPGDESKTEHDSAICSSDGPVKYPSVCATTK